MPGKDVISTLSCCFDTRGHSTITWVGVLKGLNTSFLGDLGPSSDESVLIFMIDGSLSQHKNYTPVVSVRGAIQLLLYQVYKFHRHLTHVILFLKIY